MPVWTSREFRDPIKEKEAGVDPDLVERARRGERPALEALLAMLSPRLVRLAARLAGDVGEAEELASDALFRGALKLGTLRQASSVEAWFRQVLVRLWKDRLRAARPLDRSIEDLPEPAAPPAESPEARADARELRERVAAAMARLPPAQRASARRDDHRTTTT